MNVDTYVYHEMIVFIQAIELASVRLEVHRVGWDKLSGNDNFQN